MTTIAIAGVGLIGGSFAKALRRASFGGRILGVSRPATIAAAMADGVVDEGVALEEAAERADILMLARPISKIIEDVSVAAPRLRRGAVMTDVGSTKSAVMEAAARVESDGIFIGGHPMAGREKTGIDAADPELFRGCTWFLTPRDERHLETAAAAELLRWIRAAGARTEVLAAADHDALVARTSHVPQIVSTALALAVSRRMTAERARGASGSGLKDMSRLAESPWEIWADILSTNRAAIDQALVEYLDELGRIRDLIKKCEGNQAFEDAARFAKTLRSRSEFQ